MYCYAVPSRYSSSSLEKSDSFLSLVSASLLTFSNFFSPVNDFSPQDYFLLRFPPVVDAFVAFSNFTPTSRSSSFSNKPNDEERIFFNCCKTLADFAWRGLINILVKPSFLTEGDLCLQWGQVVVTTDCQISRYSSNILFYAVVFKARGIYDVSYSLN